MFGGFGYYQQSQNDPPVRKVATALLTQLPNGDIRVRLVVEDEDVSSPMQFKTLTETLTFLKSRFKDTYRVTCNIPGNVRRD